MALETCNLIKTAVNHFKRQQGQGEVREMQVAYWQELPKFLPGRSIGSILPFKNGDCWTSITNNHFLLTLAMERGC